MLEEKINLPINCHLCNNEEEEDKDMPFLFSHHSNILGMLLID